MRHLTVHSIELDRYDSPRPGCTMVRQRYWYQDRQNRNRPHACDSILEQLPSVISCEAKRIPQGRNDERSAAHSKPCPGVGRQDSPRRSTRTRPSSRRASPLLLFYAALPIGRRAIRRCIAPQYSSRISRTLFPEMSACLGGVQRQNVSV